MSPKDFYEELKPAIDILSSVIKKYKNDDNIEIELRIGQIQFDGFKPGLGSNNFYEKIKNTLNSCKTWENVTTNKTEELCHEGVRRVVSLNGKKIIKHSYVKKEKLLMKNLNYSGTPYDIRIAVAKETPVDTKIKPGSGIIRKKDRISYHHQNNIIDLTIVEQIDNNLSTINYELEVELKNLKSEMSDTYRAHSALLLVRDMINMCEKIEADCKIDEVEKDVMNSISNLNINMN